jgi:hypothetical protein
MKIIFLCLVFMGSAGLCGYSNASCLNYLISGKHSVEKTKRYDIYFELENNSSIAVVISNVYANFFDRSDLSPENLKLFYLKEDSLKINNWPFLKKSKLIYFDEDQNGVVREYVYTYYHPKYLVNFLVGNIEMDKEIIRRVSDCEKITDR